MRRLLQPRLLLLCRKHGRQLLEHALPVVRLQQVFPLVADVDIDGIVAVRAAHLLLERQIQHLRALAQEPAVRLAAREARAVDAALLARADADGLPVIRIADRIRLRVFQRDERDEQVALRRARQLLRLRRDVLQAVLRDGHIVALLRERHAEDLLRLDRGRLVGRIHLDHEIAALALRLQDFQRLRAVRRRDDAVRHLALQKRRRLRIALIRQRHEIAIRAHAVSAARADVRRRDRRKLHALDEIHFLQHIRQRHRHGRTRRAHMLERSRRRQPRRFLELPYELPAVHRVEQVDIPRLAIQNLEWQLARLHRHLRRLLVRVAAILQFEFLHFAFSFAKSHEKRADKVQGSLAQTVGSHAATLHLHSPW